jgi:hypothetical protein
MTNTLFPTFQIKYILDFSSASRIGTLEIFQSKDVASAETETWLRTKKYKKKEYELSEEL